MPSGAQELIKLINRITQALEEANHATAENGFLAIEGYLGDMVSSDFGRLVDSASEWAESLRTTPEEWERHTRLRAACVQFLRTVGPKVGPKVGCVPVDEPIARMLSSVVTVLTSALGALSSRGVADILSSKPTEQQASFFRQLRAETDVVCQLLHAIADTVSTFTSPQELRPQEGVGVPIANFVTGPLLECLNRQEQLLAGLLQVHNAVEWTSSGRSGSSGWGDVSSFVSCEQAYGECVELSESLVRLVVKLPRLQAVLPPTSPFAHRPVLTAFDLPFHLAVAAQYWAADQLTPDVAQRQLPVVMRNAATLIKALRVAASDTVLTSPSTNDDIVDLGEGLVGAMDLVQQVLEKHPRVTEGKRHLTRYLRTTGLLVFTCIPVLRQAILECSRDSALCNPKIMSKLNIDLLHTLKRTGLMDEAVRGGLGPLLQAMFVRMEGEHSHREAGLMLGTCSQLFAAPQTASLALAVGAQGLLAAAVELCQRITAAGNRSGAPRMSEQSSSVVGGTGALLLSMCTALDSRGGTSLAADHAQLISGFLEVQVNQPGPSGGPLSITLSPFYTRPHTWAAVQASLLPAIEAASLEQLAAAQAGEAVGMDAVFRDVSVSPWTCTNPGCTNLAGCSEGQLHFMACGGCGEARYCCKECQKSDWRRHKVACRILKKSKE